MAEEQKELADGLHARITALTERGNRDCEAGRFREAMAVFSQALELIPEPREEWEAATWVLTALGDCAFQLGDFAAARGFLTRAVQAPEGLGNPFIHLRLGQAQLELGNEARAKDELARAYMGGGPEIFEDEAAKYLIFLRRFMDGI
ncbi:MAG TPA: tetratricopeptide repeat protein [Thermoanaerobaculia bacterium]|nr:tetratricopeptide repeat protein [Thermoanaerobaculia bacterium]